MTGTPDAREIRDVVWIDPAMPPAEITDPTRARLAEIYGGASLSPYWA